MMKTRAVFFLLTRIPVELTVEWRHRDHGGATAGVVVGSGGGGEARVSARDGAKCGVAVSTR